MESQGIKGWSKECQNAFEKTKTWLTLEPTLTHYNPKLPVRLASDASPHGISGILSHVMPDGMERPIAYASRSVTKTEMKYAQIDREALGIYWAVKKFYPYLYGRTFTLVTDCQSLTSIFSPSKSIPATTAARVQRYALYISGFNYDIEYKNPKKAQKCRRVIEITRTSERNWRRNLGGRSVFCFTVRTTSCHKRILPRILDYVQRGWKKTMMTLS